MNEGERMNERRHTVYRIDLQTNRLHGIAPANGSGMKLFVFRQQFLGRLRPVRIGDNTTRRANELALRFFLSADTFRATQGIDGKYRFASRDRFVRTDRTARIARGAVFIDQE